MTTPKEKKNDYSTLDGMTAEQLRAHAVTIKQTINGFEDQVKAIQAKRKPYAAELAATMGRLNTKEVAALAVE